MSSSKRDDFFALVITVFLAVYGLWIMKKALNQIRHPTHVHDLGIGWFVGLIDQFAHSTEANEKLEDHFSTPEVVRFYARLALIGGAIIAFTPIISWVIVAMIP